jgi:hypothetical protein
MFVMNGVHNVQLMAPRFYCRRGCNRLVWPDSVAVISSAMACLFDYVDNTCIHIDLTNSTLIDRLHHAQAVCAAVVRQPHYDANKADVAQALTLFYGIER